MLGHHDTVKLLAEKGSTMMTNGINLTNGMGTLKKQEKTNTCSIYKYLFFFRIGYSCLHLACVWNQLDAVKNIIATGGDIDQKTINGERPIDIAKRYQHNELIEYLQWIGKFILFSFFCFCFVIKYF